MADKQPLEFKWNSPEEEDVFKSLNNLAKYNGGYFKSNAQAGHFGIYAFQTSRYDLSEYLGKTNILARRSTNRDPETDSFLMSNFGVYNNSKMGQFTAIVEATVRWAPGIWGYKRVSWGFVLDGEGVVRVYKIHYKHRRDDSGKAIRGASGTDPSKTELLWERDIVNGTPPKYSLKVSEHMGGHFGNEDDPEFGEVELTPTAIYNDDLKRAGYVLIDMPAWLANKNGCPATIICKVLSKTMKAIQVQDIAGRVMWLPLSQIKKRGDE